VGLTGDSALLATLPVRVAAFIPVALDEIHRGDPHRH
jgi:hypothetical protein